MHWFETIMWSWLHFYADFFTIVGLIGLLVLLIGGMISFSSWIDRKVAKHEGH